MEVSSNTRDGLPASSISHPTSVSLQLSVEQWELLRRLRNSHLTKPQIIRAYDELDRLDRELGSLFNSASQSLPPPPPSPSSLSTSSAVRASDPVSPTTIVSPPSSVSLSNNNKRSHGHTINGVPTIRTVNGHHSSHVHHSTLSSNGNLRATRNNFHENASSSVTNPHEAMNQSDLEEESRELQELLA